MVCRWHRRLLRGLLLPLLLVPLELTPRCGHLGPSLCSVAEARRRVRTPRARRRLAQRLLAQGRALIKQGNYRQAIVTLNRSFGLAPGQETLLLLARCYTQVGQLEQARQLYQRLLRSAGELNRELLQQQLDEVERRLRAARPPPPEPPAPATQPAASQPGPPAGDGTEEIAPDGDHTEEIGGPEAEAITEESPLEVSGLLSGWFQSSLDIDFKHSRGGEPTDIVEDSLELRHRLLLRLDVRYGTRYQGCVSVLLDHVLREQPPEGDATFTLFNGRDLDSEFEAAVVEAYVSVNVWKLDLRAGMLRVPWGKSDYLSPNDVINPRDLRNPLRERLELLRLPVLALEATLNVKPVTFEVIWQPIFRPDTVSLWGTDYGVITPHLPHPVRGLARFIEGQVDPDLSAQVERLMVQTDLPAADLSASSIGARFALQVGGVDLSVYYSYGWDPSPRLELDVRVLQELARVDWRTARLQTLGPLLQLVDAGVPLYSSTYVRRHHVGSDIATTVGAFSLRAELGLDTSRVIYDPLFNSYVTTALSTGLGVEYQRALYQVVMLELSYGYYIDGPDEALFYDRHSLGIGGMLRWGILDGDLVGELRAFFGAMPWSYILRPQLGYKVSRRWVISAGAVILGGDTRGVGGFYSRNDLFYLEGTYNL